MQEFRDIVIAYGESDEYSFVLRKSTELYSACMHVVRRQACDICSLYHMPCPTPFETNRQYCITNRHAERRASKLVSLICSCFTGSYVRHWSEHLPGTPLQTTPIFDARAVLYPSDQSLRDYLSWRQADAHINNQVRALASVAYE